MNIKGDDNLRLTGQAITFPAEVFSRICILGSANHGDYVGEAQLIYEDGSQQMIQLSFSDWCGGPSTGEEIAFVFSGRYDNTGNTERIKCMLYYRCSDLLDKPLKSIVFLSWLMCTFSQSRLRDQASVFSSSEVIWRRMPVR
jgi:hypothetical protein